MNNILPTPPGFIEISPSIAMPVFLALVVLALVIVVRQSLPKR